jgi:hypothetical protein
MRRERVLFIRLDDEEEATIAAVAKRKGLPTATFARSTLLEVARERHHDSRRRGRR